MKPAISNLPLLAGSERFPTDAIIILILALGLVGSFVVWLMTLSQRKAAGVPSGYKSCMTVVFLVVGGVAYLIVIVLGCGAFAEHVMVPWAENRSLLSQLKSDGINVEIVMWFLSGAAVFVLPIVLMCCLLAWLDRKTGIISSTFPSGPKSENAVGDQSDMRDGSGDSF